MLCKRSSDGKNAVNIEFWATDAREFCRIWDGVIIHDDLCDAKLGLESYPRYRQSCAKILSTLQTKTPRASSS